MTGRGPTALAGWHIDRRTFLKALGLGGVSIVAGGALGARLTPFVTPAAAQTSPIDDLALRLQFDPERIFRFVADEIRYQPYAGLLRGAEGTRLARAGNAADQAALLAALLTASGIHVRFVEGELGEADSGRLLAIAATDPETISRHTIGALVEALPDGSLPAPPRSAPDADGRMAEALAAGPHVLSWARDEVLGTVELLESALVSAGKAVPAPDRALPDLERRRHVWLQMASGPGWVDLDPSFAGSSMGEVAGIPHTIMDELPDELRHRLDIRVIAETVASGGLAQETLLERSDYADGLLGLPIGFINVEHDGFKALGANISSSLSGGTTYLPCLIVGESVLVGPGAIRFGGPVAAIDEVFGAPSAAPGEAPDGEPTAEWLEITIVSPGAEPRTVRREVFDRIGPAARLDGSGLVGLTRADLVELEPGAPPDFMPAQTSHWLSVESAIVPASRLESLADDPDDPGRLAAPVHLFHVAEAAVSAGLTEDLGSHWFPDAPNITSLTVTQELTDGVLAMRPILDIWHRSLGRAPVAGVETTVSPLAGGVLAHVAERIVFGEGNRRTGPATPGPSVGAVFDLARSDGLPIRTLQSSMDLSGLPFSADTIARLRAALDAGHLVLVPERPVTIGGVERTGWWRIDPVSGWTTDEMDDGRGTSAGEELLQLWNQLKSSPALIRLGKCVGFLFVAALNIYGGIGGGIYIAASGGGGSASALGAVAAAAGGVGGASSVGGAIAFCA